MQAVYCRKRKTAFWNYENTGLTRMLPPNAAGDAQRPHFRPTRKEKRIDIFRKLWLSNSMNGDWNNCPEVEKNPGKVSGVWVFKGTRVPVRALFDNIEDGASIDDFLEWFPGVTRHQVETVLEHVSSGLLLEQPA